SAPAGTAPTGLVTFSSPAVNVSNVSVTNPGTAGAVVTVTVARAIPVVVGQQVTIANNTGGTNINGTFTVTAIVTSGGLQTGFKYASPNAVAGNNDGTATSIDTAPVTQVIQNVGGLPQITFVATFTAAAGSFSAGTYSISANYTGD